MEKEFVPYELAVKLKALGFDEPCVAFYEQSKKLSIGFNWLNEGGKNSNLQECTAPLFQQAFRWFREEYGIYYVIEGSKKFGFQHTIYDEKETYEIKSEKTYNTYEEAELACLNKLIEIVKI